MPLVYLGLGTNLGDRENNLRSARERLALLQNTTLLKNAPVYETPPLGGPSGQGAYLNSAVLLETALAPREFLSEIHAIERELGRRRERETVRWGPRTIDMDILLWDDVVFDSEELVIPHPRIAERAFVLLPLADLDRNLRHPALGLTIGELLQQLMGTHSERATDGNYEGIRRLPL